VADPNSENTEKYMTLKFTVYEISTRDQITVISVVLSAKMWRKLIICII